MENSKCPICGGLNRARGTELHQDTHSDPVWRKILICTICAHRSTRPLSQQEYADLLASFVERKRAGRRN